MMSDDVTFAGLRLPTDLVDNLGGWGITEPKKLALLVAADEENSAGDLGQSGLVPPDTLLRLLTDTLYNHYVAAEVPRLHTSAVDRDGGPTYRLSLTASNFSLDSSVTISTLLKQNDPEVEFGFSFRQDPTVNPFAELQTEFGSLASRERDAVAARFGLEGQPPATLEEIGRLVGVTRQGAFTILQRAVKRLQYPALTHLLDPLHRFIEWYAGSLSTLPTDSLFAQRMERDFPVAPRPVSGWLHLLAAIRLGNVEQSEEDRAGRLVKPPSELISVGQVAAILNVHQNTVRRWAAEGRLTAYRVGTRGDRRFHRTEVEQLLNRVEEWTPNLRGAS